MDSTISASAFNVPEEEGLKASDCTSEPSNELSCNVCDCASESEGGLKISLGRKHNAIPQLDGEIDDDQSKQVSELSELEIVKEILEKYILSLDPKTLKNQPVKEVSKLKLA